MTGHPAGTEWFCKAHFQYAQRYSNLASGAALVKMRKAFWKDIFLLVVGSSLITGIFGALGSIALESLGTSGLLAGALIGGLIGAVVSGFLAVKAKLLDHSALIPSITGGFVGFLFAAIVAIGVSASSDSLFVSAISTLLIGVGFLVGRRVALRG
jgi:hypothetical protein